MTSEIEKIRRSAANAELAGRIVAARQALDLTPADLARRMGISPATLAAWESGRSQPRTNRLVTLAGLLAVSPSWLLSGLGDGPADPSPEVRMEALSHGIVELRQLTSRIGQRVNDLERRLEALKQSI